VPTEGQGYKLIHCFIGEIGKEDNVMKILQEMKIGDEE
jgi:hypothetical protein